MSDVSGMSRYELPMFPLGTVLLPGMVLPLHVFEPRYRALVDRCLASDRRFGVVMIERGSEVGGGDERTDVGTVAEIVDLQRFDDGRVALIAVGCERVRVVEWLPDDPHPMAMVEELPDANVDDDWPELLADVTRKLRSLLAMASEAGFDVPPATFELADDPSSASNALVILSPLGPADRWRLLRAPGPSERLSLLGPMLDDQSLLISASVVSEGPQTDDDPLG